MIYEINQRIVKRYLQEAHDDTIKAVSDAIHSNPNLIMHLYMLAKHGVDIFNPHELRKVKNVTSPYGRLVDHRGLIHDSWSQSNAIPLLKDAGMNVKDHYDLIAHMFDPKVFRQYSHEVEDEKPEHEQRIENEIGANRLQLQHVEEKYGKESKEAKDQRLKVGGLLQTLRKLQQDRPKYTEIYKDPKNPSWVNSTLHDLLQGHKRQKEDGTFGTPDDNKIHPNVLHKIASQWIRMPKDLFKQLKDSDKKYAIQHSNHIMDLAEFDTNFHHLLEFGDRVPLETKLALLKNNHIPQYNTLSLMLPIIDKLKPDYVLNTVRRNKEIDESNPNESGDVQRGDYTTLNNAVNEHIHKMSPLFISKMQKIPGMIGDTFQRYSDLLRNNHKLNWDQMLAILPKESHGLLDKKIRLGHQQSRSKNSEAVAEMDRHVKMALAQNHGIPEEIYNKLWKNKPDFTEMPAGEYLYHKDLIEHPLSKREHALKFFDKEDFPLALKSTKLTSEDKQNLFQNHIVPGFLGSKKVKENFKNYHMKQLKPILQDPQLGKQAVDFIFSAPHSAQESLSEIPEDIPVDIQKHIFDKLMFTPDHLIHGSDIEPHIDAFLDSGEIHKDVYHHILDNYYMSLHPNQRSTMHDRLQRSYYLNKNERDEISKKFHEREQEIPERDRSPEIEKYFSSMEK